MKNRLLIADRNGESCEVYRRFLTERGYEVETSTDGLDCLAKLRQVRPVVLVLDLELLWGGLEDHRLVERVERALWATGHGALRTVSVSIDAGIVILGGRVASYYLKQVAQTAVSAVSGAHQIRNSVDVVRPNSNQRVEKAGSRLPIIGPQGQADFDGPRR